MSKKIEIEVFSVDERARPQDDQKIWAKTVSGKWRELTFSPFIPSSRDEPEIYETWFDESGCGFKVTHWCELPKLED